MADLKYDIAALPDYPALQQLARALWRNGSVRGAAVLVGAGLSKNAQRPADDTPEPPLWWELLAKMVERLYPHDTRAAPTNPLRIAEEYRTYFGQAGLDDFIRTQFPNQSWSPGPLHMDLLELPWTDVLTTNWDTLLERASESTVDYSYEVVRTEADLTYAKSPRIVKLHGTIGDAGPLIFAEEDYRTYPAKYAAFVNFARQVFIENELCLVGFSGDDPNFLQWAGWVRDHLGGSARRIYLVGNLRLERATRKYLEAHNIAPMDLAPLVKDLPRKVQHEAATRIFIDELRKAKPPLPHKWNLTPPDQFPLSRAGVDAYQRVHKDHALAADPLKKTIPLFRADRENYPGWFVCPARHRRTLGYAGDGQWLVRKAVLDLLEPKQRAEAVFEILWRRTAAFIPLDVHLAAALTEFVDTKPPDVDSDMRLEFALALLRDARISYEEEGLKRWAAVIESEAAAGTSVRQACEYQLCLRARDRMDFSGIAARLGNIISDDPIWKLRRAALHTEIGEYVTATKLIAEATAELERRYRLDRNSLSIKSQLGWASWLSRATAVWSTRWDDLPQPRDFAALDIDPPAEIESMERTAADIEEKRREDAIRVQPAFEAGHYREGSSRIHIGSGDSGALLLYEFDQLIEQAGLPLRINHVNICADTAIAAVEAAFQPILEWHVWLLRALHSHLDKPFERHFSRIAIARMPAATSSALISIIESAIEFWTRRFKVTRGSNLQDDSRHAVDVLRLLLITLSRLTVHMSPEQAENVLRRAVEMAKDPDISFHWLIEALGELAKYAVKAAPTTGQGALALCALEFPLPSEKNGHIPTHPQIVTQIWNVPPVREDGDTRWDHRVHQLLIAADKGRVGREHAILRLAYLAIRNVLKPEESAAFGKVLWSDVDDKESPLPLNTSLTPAAFLQLPAPDGIDVQARLKARLFDADLREAMKLPTPTGTITIGAKIDSLTVLALTIQNGLTLPADTAARMFDEVVAWEVQVINRQDQFAAAMVKSFNDDIRVSAGHLLTIAVVPALRADQRTEQRARNLIAFISRTRSWTSMGALAYFVPSAPGVAVDVISVIRTGFLGSQFQQVMSAAEAVSGWAKLARDGILPELPRSLVEQLITTIETRQISLTATLSSALILLNSNCLQTEDLKRLMQAMSRIRRELRYEDVEFDTMEAVSISLIRAECVKLAVALKDRIADDDGTIEAWIDEAKSDPLPEVRFSLMASS